MRDSRWIALLGLLVVGCVDPRIGDRFRADRDVWLADYEYRNLAVRPDLVTRDQWHALIDLYEAIPPRYAHVEGDTSLVGRQIRRATAQAAFSAVQIQSALGDTAAVLETLGAMRERYADMDAIVAQAALSQGAIAERRGRALQAAEYYSEVVSRADLTTPAANEAGMELDLYLRIARLRAGEASEAERPSLYAAARAYYEAIVETEDRTELGASAQTLLAEISVDLREWSSAERQLVTLEEWARDTGSERFPPEGFRLRRADLHARSGADQRDVRALLQSIIDDYPSSPFIPQVYVTLAGNAATRGEIEEAIGYIDRLRALEIGSDDVVSGAMLTRARLMASIDGRWPDALAAYRELTVEHPISEAALTAPLEIALRYRTTGETDAMKEALTRAVREYRDFIERFPPSDRTLLARRKLAESLMLNEDFAGAVTEMERLGEVAGSTRTGALVLVDAARLAMSQLADTARTVDILDRIAAMEPRSDVGLWASSEADRLRGEAMP